MEKPDNSLAAKIWILIYSAILGTALITGFVILITAEPLMAFAIPIILLIVLLMHIKSRARSTGCR